MNGIPTFPAPAGLLNPAEWGLDLAIQAERQNGLDLAIQAEQERAEQERHSKQKKGV